MFRTLLTQGCQEGLYRTGQMDHPSATELAQQLVADHPDLVASQAYGETSLFYNRGNRLTRGTYFATIKQTDGPNDQASALDRDGVYRFNFGLPRQRFEAMFGPTPTRPAKGNTIKGPWDFTQVNELMPHPVYGWMGWVAVLNPAHDLLAALEPDLALAYAKSIAAFDKRIGRQDALTA